MSFLKNRTVLGILCIVLALIICFAITPLFNRSISQKVEIVRVSKDIKVGEQIDKGMVQSVEVGGFNLPEAVIKNMDNAVGKYATAEMLVGDYILSSKLSDVPAAENAYLYSLTGEKQAISITVKSFANGLSGKLISGDIVSVIAPDFKKLGATVIPRELQYVEVISVTAPSGYDANQRDAMPISPLADEEKELPVTVTLLVTPTQSKILAELEADGAMHLSLVYRGTKENAHKFILSQDEILQKIDTATKEEPPVDTAIKEAESVD